MSLSSPSRRSLARSAAPVVGLLVAGLLVWQGSTAAFTATTTSPGNSWTAGTVALDNNSNAGVFAVTGAATFNVNNVKPGDTLTRCVTVRSNGSVAGGGRFYATAVTGALAPRIFLTVDSAPATVTAGVSSVPANCAGIGTTTAVLPSTALGSLPTSYATAANSWTLTGTAGEARVYRITYDFVSTGSNVTDNTFQGTSAGATFNWEVQ
jgi:hypothetical protein